MVAEVSSGQCTLVQEGLQRIGLFVNLDSLLSMEAKAREALGTGQANLRIIGKTDRPRRGLTETTQEPCCAAHRWLRTPSLFYFKTSGLSLWINLQGNLCIRRRCLKKEMK